MVLLLVTILCSSIVASSNEVASWKENFYVKSGKYQVAYKLQVFQSNFAASSNGQSIVKKNHNYHYPGSNLSHMTGYSVSGFLGENGVDFTNFKNSFERYCYMPCDGMSSFYNRYLRLKKFLWNVPFLNVLIPYWVEGDIVQEIAVDRLESWLKEDTVASCSKLPDIPLNILYSKDDPLVSKESATVLCE